MAKKLVELENFHKENGKVKFSQSTHCMDVEITHNFETSHELTLSMQLEAEFSLQRQSEAELRERVVTREQQLESLQKDLTEMQEKLHKKEVTVKLV